MPENEPPADGIDWRLTTWDGSRREQLRRWAALPLERVILAIEEMQDLTEHFQRMDDEGGMTKPLTTAEAAALLGLSEREVQYLAKKGQIFGAKKLGRDWRFPPNPQVHRQKRGRPVKRLEV